ncbi:MAG: VanZ family protein [Stenomitos frigidus ULC029]
MARLQMKWSLGIVGGSLGLIVLATLAPFNFALPDALSPAQIASQFLENASDLDDALANILLFMPFGFGLAGWLQKKNGTRLNRLLVILLTSGGVSLTVEVLQVFLAARSPSYTDLLTNSIGGFLGFLIFNWCHFNLNKQLLKLTDRRKQYGLRQKLIVGVVIYNACIVSFSFSLQNAANLSNWDASFPLLLGNEREGDRPWQGKMAMLYIADRAISETEIMRVLDEDAPSKVIGNALMAAYQFSNPESADSKALYQDSYQDLMGNLPSLVWQGKSEVTQTDNGVSLSATHWLATATPVMSLNQALRKASQFTLITKLATTNIKQTGPARILSLSNNPFSRNLMLGQKGKQLIVRLRTPITGENGAFPELSFLDVFNDTKYHYLVVTYSHAAIHVYIDNVQNSHIGQLTPEITFFRYLSPLNNYGIQLSVLNQSSYKIFYYGLLFIPLGVFLAFIVLTFTKWSYCSMLLFGCMGILLPALILESVLAITGMRSMKPANLLLSAIFSSSTMFFIKAQVQFLLEESASVGEP